MFFQKLSRRILNFLLLSCLLFAILTPTAKFTAAYQGTGAEQVWEVSMSTNVRGPANIFIENNCKQAQTFSVVSDLPYMSFPDGRTIVVPGKQTKPISVIFDTHGLSPGKHQGSAEINCDSCGQNNCGIKRTLPILLVLTEQIPAQISVEDLVNALGPQVSETHAPDAISIRAFATGGAPGIVEFTSMPGDSAMLTIEVNGARPFTQILKGPRQVRIEVKGASNTSQTADQGVTQQVKFKLPEEFGKKPRIASISISPLGNSTNFVIDGLGLGDKAVGSITIDQLTFQPAGSQNYVYNFRALRDFEKWGAEILLMTRAADNRLLGRRVKTVPVELKIDRGTQKNGRWNGTNDSGQISHGQHKVQVRVWRTASGGSGGDWVVRISQQQVQVQ